MLAELAAHPGQTVTKADLFRLVWPDLAVTDDSLVQCIADIRRALGKADRDRIETLPKVGYRLRAGPAADRPANWLRWGLACAVLLVLAGVWFLRPSAAPLPDRPRIAVMAFADFSEGADQGYLSDAIAEGLITELARFPALGVISRTSAFSYRDSDEPLETIASELGVHYVLQGSQQKVGNTLKVTAQLIETRGGEHVWSETYTRDLADVFAVQEEIVRAIAYLVADVTSTRPLPASDLDQFTALQYFRKARGRPLNRQDVEHFFELGNRAQEVDPGSEWGHLIHGWAHRHMAVFFATPQEKVVHLERASHHADAALAIAPQNHNALWLRARIQAERGDHEAAANTYRLAIEINPSDTRMLVGSAGPLLYTGQFEEALAIIDRALDIDPRHTGWFHWQRAWALWELGRCAEARDSFGRMSQIPTAALRMLAATHACLGDSAAAHQALLPYLAENPEHTLEREYARLAPTWPLEASVARWMDDMAFAGMPAD